MLLRHSAGDIYIFCCALFWGFSFILTILYSVGVQIDTYEDVNITEILRRLEASCLECVARVLFLSPKARFPTL